MISRIRRAAGALVAGSVVGAVIATPLTIYFSRERPEFVNLTISDKQIHAGEAVHLDKHTVIPEDCIPKMKRWITYDDGDSEVLTDAAGPDNGPSSIPTSIHLTQGCGTYHERMVDIGCGTMSGFFRPLAASSVPVRLCVLEPLPIAAAPVSKGSTP